MTAYALHTCLRIAREVLDRGHHFLFTIKANEPKLPETLGKCHWSGDAHRTGGGNHRRIVIGTIRVRSEVGCDVRKPWINSPGIASRPRRSARSSTRRTGASATPRRPA